MSTEMAINESQKVASETMEADDSRVRCDSGGTEFSLSLGRSRSDSGGSNSIASSWSSDAAVDVAVDTAKKPLDGGYGWLVVCGAIITGAVVPGLFMCFGVFMNAFLLVFPHTSKTAASWIPSILNSLMNLMGPVTSLLVNAYSCRSVTLAGGVILSSGLVLSFFTTNIEALYFTYGLLGGIGSGLALAPGLYLISQYFQKRRGVATGVCMAASSGGQIAFPYLLQYLLAEYSYRGCILILGGITMNICVSAALYRPLEDNFRTSPNKMLKLDIKSTKRKRTVSQSSRRSSQSFLAESNGFADLSTTVWQKKLNNIQIAEKSKRSKRKKGSDGKSKKSSSHKKAAESAGSSLQKVERSLTNGSQPLLTVDSGPSPRNRSRTMSIESNWVLPGIPEEEHEGDDDNVNEQTNLIDEVEIINANPKDFEVPSIENKGEANLLNNNVTTNETLVCSRPLLPQDVTVVVTVVGEDELENSSNFVNTLQQCLPKHRNSCPESFQAVSCMHHPFGSIASIASSVKEPPSVVKPPFLQRLSTSLGFNYFKYGIFYILSLSFTCLIVILGSYTMYMPTYGFSIGLSREDSAGLVSIISIASTCGRLIVPSAPDYIPVKRKHVYSGCTIVLAAAIILTAYAEAYSVLVTSLVFFGFTSGGCIAISLNVYLEYIPVKDFASFFGLSQLIVGVVVLFASPLFGLLLDSAGGYTIAYFIMSFLAVISGSVLFLDRFVKQINSSNQSSV